MSFYTFGMEWQIFALLQMALITVGVALAFGLHNRKLASQNTQLRAHLDQKQAALESPAPTDPKEALRAAIASTDTETPFQPLFLALAENVLSPAEDFSERLVQLLTELELGTPSDTQGGDSQALQARIAELEAELAAAQNDPIDPDDVQSEELKTLLQQFTHDSREMMACIQALEEENADLKTELEALKGPEEETENTTSGDEPADTDPSTDPEEPEAVDVDQLMEAQEPSVGDPVAAEETETSAPTDADVESNVDDEERLAAPPQRAEAETNPAEKNDAKDEVA